MVSTLVYDGARHTISLIDGSGKTIGSWEAYNNIEASVAAEFGPSAHLKDGKYPIKTSDMTAPHKHPGDDVNGRYGAFGIIRIIYPGHYAIGVHSGRLHGGAKNPTPGPKHPTEGCIRTTEAAMKEICNTMKADPVQSITIIGNNEISIKSGIIKSNK